MAEKKSDLSYKYLYEKHGEDAIRERASYWYQMAQKVIISFGLKDKAYINKRLLINMLVNYFADIERLKEFHIIERVNTTKIFAYGVFWLLRLSPIQLRDEIPDSKLFINETFAAMVLVAEFLPENYSGEVKSSYIDDLRYFFKYRIYTAQTIESQITALRVGAGENPFKKADLGLKQRQTSEQ